MYLLQGGFMNISKLQGPAETYKHQHPTVKNVNHEFKKQITRGQRISDLLAKIVGSWPFIIYQSIVIVVWMAVNVYLVYKGTNDSNFFSTWDPYPFILLNLVLSFQAAYTGPVVMMSQNRQAEKDRLMAEHDFEINKKAEEEIKIIMDHLVHQDIMTKEIIDRLEKLSPDSQ
jgi:uncharacterized membrane protein